ncbi:MAG: very short patch repair endonuclease [Acidobacteriota bacterium]
MDTFSKEKRSEIMRAVKSEDSQAELIVRRMLHRAGFRYRLHVAALPGKPDVVFPSRRKVIFIHGCFWHLHKNCPAARHPSSNVEYWEAKLKRNVERDRKNRKKLKALGWTTLVVWECKLKNPDAVFSALIRFLSDSAL